MFLLDFGSSYRDEMLATAVVLTVTIAGSFFLLDRYKIQDNQPEEDKGNLVLGTNTSNGEIEKSLDIENNTGSLPPTATPTPTPTLEPAIVEVPYGASQTFENDDYVLKFSNPLLIVGVSKKYVVNVVLGNKNVVGEGMTNALLATISRDGEVVADDVPMTLTEAKRVKKGEQITYKASLSMVDGTDITKVSYKPTGGVVASNYLVKP